MTLWLAVNTRRGRKPEPMAMTQDQLQKVQGMLDHLDHNTPQDMENRRKSPRLPVRMSLTASLLSGPAPTNVDIFTRNFSMAGFGFVSRRMFGKDERIAIYIKFPNDQSKLVLARVTFGRYIRNGLYEMGSEFLECVSNPKSPGRFPSHWSNISPF